mgnify:FL=1
MFSIKSFRHDQITSTIIDEIIKVKSVAWNFDYAAQKDWIKNNLKDTDIHLLLFQKEKVIAYLNLIELDIKVDVLDYKAYGIGNVCALEKGRGWGKELIVQTNKYLIKKDKVGLLFCREKLIKFYHKNDWVIVNNNQLTLLKKDIEIFTMMFNLPNKFINITYMGHYF